MSQVYAVHVKIFVQVLVVLDVLPTHCKTIVIAITVIIFVIHVGNCRGHQPHFSVWVSVILIVSSGADRAERWFITPYWWKGCHVIPCCNWQWKHWHCKMPWWWEWRWPSLVGMSEFERRALCRLPLKSAQPLIETFVVPANRAPCFIWTVAGCVWNCCCICYNPCAMNRKTKRAGLTVLLQWGYGHVEPKS